MYADGKTVKIVTKVAICLLIATLLICVTRLFSFHSFLFSRSREMSILTALVGLNAVQPTRKRSEVVRRRRILMEQLEGRRLLAGDVTAEVMGDTLVVSGDQRGNSVAIDSFRKLQDAGQKVTDGVTGVFLDLPLLEDVGLEFSGASDNTVPPPEGDFQVGFAITPDSNFRYAIEDGFAPLAGEILHEGTVSFNDGALEIGDFAIGFDADRAIGDASGFFVADTFSNLGPLFDLGVPEEVDAEDDELTIKGSDLLVAPELAGILGDATLFGADIGDAQIDAEAVRLVLSQVHGGKTSVELDLPLLEAAAGLTVSSINGTAEPAADNFQVAFAIESDSDFRYSIADGFAPDRGTIEHSGTVGFNDDAIIVGDFSIGFDPSRATDNATGFFVEDTVSGLGVLFDIGGYVQIDARPRWLSIEDADLLVSSEFASTLGDTALTGADVGNAQIDALGKRFFQEYLRIRGNGRTLVNDARSDVFSTDTFTDVSIDLMGGNDRVAIRKVGLDGGLAIDMGDGRRDRVRLRGVDVDKALTIVSGSGRDNVGLRFVDVGSLAIETGAARDRVSLQFTRVAGDAAIGLGRGNDRLRSIFTAVAGQAAFDGGAGFDRFDSFFSLYGDLDTEDFERGWFY
jgi:hypothetical protein